MIFVTVGTQLGFDRLIKAVERWNVENNSFDITYQIGDGKYKPRIGDVYKYISPEKVNDLQVQSELVIGHAGVGTILTRLEINKPIVIMPRLYQFGEHRNDHQLATSKRLLSEEGVFVAFNESELDEKIHQALRYSGELGISKNNESLDFLINNLKRYING